MVQLKSLGEFSAGLPVCGISQLHQRIYVVCLESSTIRVFSDTPPYLRHQDIVVDTMDDPNDMAASTTSAQLYVVDWGYHCVWKVSINLSDQPEVQPEVSKWITSISPWAISVGPSGGVLVTPRLVVNESCSSQGYLYLHDQDYSEKSDDSVTSAVERIPLPLGVTVEHAIETHRETFVVCYTSQFQQMEKTHDKTASICELSRSGEVLKNFEIRRGECTIDWPRHLTVVADDESCHGDEDEQRFVLLVSEFNGGQVVVFDDEMRLVSIATKDEEVYQPRRLSYQQSNRVLCVGQYNGIVSVFRIMKPA